MKNFIQAHLMRSLMFVPAHREKLLESAINRSADVLLLDLEDSVQPAENKVIARENIKNWVSKGKFADFLVFPRVNDRESGELLRDAYELTIEGIHGFMYPKSKKGEDVYFFDKLLETIEYEKGIPVGTFKIIPLIETAAAVLNAQEICQASDRVIAIAYGCEDFIADLGGIHDEEGQSLFTPRAIIAMAAKAHGILPIDTVHVNVHDLEELEQNLKVAKNLGFEGMMVLNPKELELVHRYFSPSAKEIKDAEEMLKLADQAKSQGNGVAMINGKFIGPPMILAAQKVLKKKMLIEKKNSR
ncbi:CoA ester lyase [Algoriphagus sp. NF]|uniref:CoA ester lyase n=1 Tax=Algoriphagus marincola TaxID=264027 RepID=A0ABS7N4S8_9BACT|nr:MULTISPECIES: CoA ester lyase [Algoriphagus]MBY5950918.1 CoA ester lyase [Algoriphagus marincola]MDE0558590.1 CoA ester lyase [Algoriphagus sp. NF]